MEFNEVPEKRKPIREQTGQEGGIQGKGFNATAVGFSRRFSDLDCTSEDRSDKVNQNVAHFNACYSPETVVQ